jgi:Fe-S-cluster-containing dehydrogenase component
MTYSFSIYSGGEVIFDHDACLRCETKACVLACDPRGSGSILELRDGKPYLKISSEDARKGQCSECLACEEACDTVSMGGLRIELPMPALEKWLQYLTKKNDRPVYLRTD